MVRIYVPKNPPFHVREYTKSHGSVLGEGVSRGGNPMVFVFQVLLQICLIFYA